MECQVVGHVRAERGPTEAADGGQCRDADTEDDDEGDQEHREPA
jgi:hypothetical protein